VNEEEEEILEYTFAVNEVTTRKNEDLLTAELGGVTVKLLIDSGASSNVLDKAFWLLFKKNKIKGRCENTTKNLFSYGSDQPLELLGKFTSSVKVCETIVEFTFFVVNGKGVPLLERELANLGVLKLEYPLNQIVDSPKPEPVKEIATNCTLQTLKQDFPSVFEGVGTLNNYKLKLFIKPDVCPVAQSPRRIPYQLRDAVADKLKGLEKQGFIEAVTEPSEWVSAIEPSQNKSGEMRLCIDMREANSAKVRERHRIPNMDEVLPELSGSTVFSKIDLRSAFHQIVLDESTQGITTFATHTGLYR
jgi:hypothetical protein